MRKKLPWALGALLLSILLLTSLRTMNLQEVLSSALAWIEQLGALGMGLFILLYIIACVCLIPASLLTLGAGAIYGLQTGFWLVSVGALLGATAAFLISRYVARKWIAHKIDGHARFQALDHAVANEGWKLVLLSRLSPIFSFTLLNYAYGLTRVSLRHYVLASCIGMMPGTLLYTYFGVLAGKLTQLNRAPEQATSPAQWAFYALGLVATLLITVYLTKIAQKVLNQKLEPA